MVFNDFRFRVAFRVILIGITMALIVYMITRPNMVFAAGLTILVVIFQLVELYRFSSQTNRKLTRFLESVKYSDFISGFTSDNRLGRSFRDLNQQFNEVLEAFRKARSEKEEHWQYLNSVVQQVRTGIFSYDSEGNVQLMNANARRYLNVDTNMKNISELAERNRPLYEMIDSMKPGKSGLYKRANDIQLTINMSELRIRGNVVKLVTLQNIQTELQRQELEAWQNLTRVLRHEIMNSITPISSLTSTLKEILDKELVHKDDRYELKNEGAEDLREGLDTIESRSKGLIKFIDAYREYTSLPQPQIKTVRLKELIEKVGQLMKTQLKNSHVKFSYTCRSEYLTVQADEEMIEQVLINLVKNAIESIGTMANGEVTVRGDFDENTVYIDVMDNGPGIIAEALTRIFVPFFTTKKSGSGIGLSLSRQIMQMHNGTLTVESTPYVKTVFRMKF
jgi:two-component system, NtrC family, nitrogen regulation sensor histidine kinase NtrY